MPTTYVQEYSLFYTISLSNMLYTQFTFEKVRKQELSIED